MGICRSISALPRALVLIALTMGGCGGGGGGDATPAPPVEIPVNLGMLGTSQGVHAGRILITVIDRRTGTPINGAIVNLGLSGLNFVATDANGYATFGGLVPGSPQIVTAAEAGYWPQTLYNVTAKNITFSLFSGTWTRPDIAGTVSGISPGPTGRRGYVSSDSFFGFLGEEAGLDTSSTTQTTVTYGRSMLANRPFAIAATQITNGEADNFVLKTGQPALDPLETRTVDLAFPAPAPTSVSLSGGLVTASGTITSSTVRMHLIFPNSFMSVAEGSGTLGTSNNGILPYTLKYFPAAGVERYQIGLTVSASNGERAAFGTTTNPPTALPSLTMPNIPLLLSPPDQATAQGINPTLSWSPVADASLYVVFFVWGTTAQSIYEWMFFVPAGTTSLSIPNMPPGLAALGLATGIGVSWGVAALVASPFDMNDFTEASILRNRTGTASHSSQTFTP